MRTNIDKILSAQAMASSANSSIIDLRDVINMSLQFVTSSAASPTGTVAIQFADDCKVNADGSISGGTWAVDAAAAAAPVVTANGAKIWNMSEIGHAFCRVAYTAGTGTGTLDITAVTKGA